MLAVGAVALLSMHPAPEVPEPYSHRTLCGRSRAQQRLLSVGAQRKSLVSFHSPLRALLLSQTTSGRRGDCQPVWWRACLSSSLVFPGYQISWEVYGKNDSRLTHTLNSTTLEYKIQGLSSLTTYTIDVAAVTAAGVGLTTSSTISSGVPPGQWSYKLFLCKLFSDLSIRWHFHAESTKCLESLLLRRVEGREH